MKVYGCNPSSLLIRADFRQGVEFDPRIYAQNMYFSVLSKVIKRPGPQMRKSNIIQDF